MTAAFIQKAYEKARNQCTKDDSIKIMRKTNADKFVLYIFDYLTYD